MGIQQMKQAIVVLTALLMSGGANFQRATLASTETQAGLRAAPAPSKSHGDVSKRSVLEALDNLALQFEEVRNHGDHAKFAARSAGIEVGIMATETVMRLNGATEAADSPPSAHSSASGIVSSASRLRSEPTALSMKLIGANPRARIVGENQLATRTNYFIGNDASRWRKGVANYARVRVEHAYRGIDVIYYGSGKQLEYDFKVAPEADFKAIRLRVSGARSVRPLRVRLDETGDLLIEAAAGTLTHRKPAAYQEINGVRQEIPARYVINRSHEIEFAVGEYDKHHPLVIDPVVSYLTYFGGHQDDRVSGIAVDAAGYVYITGTTFSLDFPVRSTLQAYHPFGSDIFVAKLDGAGTGLLYSTYLGGYTGDTATGIAVDASGNAYVTGATGSNDFPVTAGAFQTNLVGARSVNAFILKLAADGSSLSYSTLLGGSGNGNNNAFDFSYGIAVDTSGNAYVTGRTASNDFPTTPGAVQRVLNHYADAFVTKLNADGSSLVYSMYLGGSEYEEGLGISLDATGNAYVTGYTQSKDFPVTPGALQSNNTGQSLWDVFVSKINTTGTALVYSTYFGGSGTETGNAISVDPAGNAYVAGETDSIDFPTTSGALKREFGGGFYKSTNGGNQWKVSNAGLPDTTLRALAVDPKTAGRLFLATNAGVFTSTNGGDSWTLRSSIYTNTLLIDPTSPTTLYAIGSDFISAHGIVKSTDSGSTWASVNTGLPSIFNSNLLVMDPVNPSTLYVGGFGYDSSGGEGPPFVRYFFKTTDGGSSWHDIPTLPLYQAPDSLVIDPHNPSKIFLNSASVFYRSQDGGQSWRQMSNHSGYGPLAVDPNAPGLLYGIGLSVGKSTNDGRTWIAASSGLPASLVANCAAVVPTSPTSLYVGSSDGIFKSSDAASSWQQNSLRGSVTFVAFNPVDPATIYTGVNVRSHAFVAKLNAAGSALQFATYLGGQISDAASSVVVDKDDNVYIGGQTYSSDFPTLNGLQTSKPQTIRDSSNTSSGFVTKLSGSTGELLYSTYLGGDDYATITGLALNAHGAVYIAGETLAANFPTQNAFQSAFGGQIDSFIVRLDAPFVSSVSISGKQLIVVGGGFDPGAIVLVNDQEQRTKNSLNPTFRLVARKAAVGIAPGQTVKVRVRNTDHTLSNEFVFTRPSVE